jgi:uncharacterized protein
MRFVKLCVAALALVALVALADSFAPGQAKKDDKTAAAVFEVYTDNGGQFRFRLNNGEEKLAISAHGYKTKDEVLKVIDAIKAQAGKAKVEDQPKK